MMRGKERSQKKTPPPCVDKVGLVEMRLFLGFCVKKIFVCVGGGGIFGFERVF